MSEVLKVLMNIEELLKKKNELPADLLVELMKTAASGKDVNDKTVQAATKIHTKMPGLTEAEKKQFTEFVKENPMIINDGEVIQSTSGNTVTLKTTTQQATTVETFKIENGERKRHGESKTTYPNGDHETYVYDNGKFQSETTYMKGLTRNIKYGENEKEVSRTFGLFDHLPRVLPGQNKLAEKTPFMQFQETLCAKIKGAKENGYKQICLHYIDNYDYFSDWVTAYAEAKGFTVDNDCRHLSW
jgi:hypothetical protein